MSFVYIAIDGDNIGSQLEYFVITNQEEALQNFFNRFQYTMDWLEDKLVKLFHATIIFNGGDNLLAKIPANTFSIEETEKIRHRFIDLSQNTLSVGIGDSSRKAYFALKLAKSSGKNRICIFEELKDG